MACGFQRHYTYVRRAENPDGVAHFASPHALLGVKREIGRATPCQAYRCATPAGATECSTTISGSAAAGGCTFPARISDGVTFLP